MEGLSHFEEKAGIVTSDHEWGRWYQTLREVSVEIPIPHGTSAKDLKVSIKPTHLDCRMASGQILLKGSLFSTIIVDESIWTIEERKILRVAMAKANSSTRESVWTSLMRDDYRASPEVEKQMRSKIDLERFQMEYPGMDFSGAKLL